VSQQSINNLKLLNHKENLNSEEEEVVDMVEEVSEAPLFREADLRYHPIILLFRKVAQMTQHSIFLQHLTLKHLKSMKNS